VMTEFAQSIFAPGDSCVQVSAQVVGVPVVKMLPALLLSVPVYRSRIMTAIDAGVATRTWVVSVEIPLAPPRRRGALWRDRVGVYPRNFVPAPLRSIEVSPCKKKRRPKAPL
jgi:hypothetical protein